MSEEPKTPKTDDVLELQSLETEDVEGHGCVSTISLIINAE